MEDGVANRQTPIREVEPSRSSAAKVERVSYSPAGPEGADTGTDAAAREWKRAFDAAHDAIWLTDRDFRITRANLASARVLGKPLDEIVGKTCAEAIHGTGQPQPDCPLAQVHRTKSHARGEIYVRTPEVWLEISADPVLDVKGDLSGVLHVLRDVTERHQREETQRESEREFEDLFENAREAILLIDRNGTLTRVNRLVEEYGFPPEELIGRRLFDFVVDDHRARAIADFEVLLGGRPVKGEMDVVTPRGVVSVEYRDNPIIRDDRIVGVQAILTDVTDRKQAERRLREERDKAQKYLDIAGVMLIGIDTERRVGLINKKGCEILDYAEPEVLGKNWFDHFLPPHARTHARALFDSLMAGHTPDYEYLEGTVRTRTGRERLIGWHNTILKDSTGRIIGTLSSGEDITERKRAENAYRSLVDHSLQGLVIFQDGKAVFTNQTMAEIAGYTVDEVLAMSPEQIRDFVHPEDREAVWQNHRRRLAGEPVPEHYELRGIRKDGTVRWLDLHASRIDYRGRPAIQAAYIDTTERKQAEETLRLSEERYRGIFENAVLGMYQTTPDGEILAANPTLVRMLGYDTFEELASRNLEEEGYEAEHPRSLFQECIEADGQVVGLESAWKRRDGSTLWVRESARVVRDETGKTLFYEGTVEDITDRKHADRLMQTLATTAMELVELPPEADLFQFIGEKVLALIGAGIVSVHSIDGDTLTVRHLTGATTIAMRLAQRLLGKAVIGMSIKGVHEVARTSLLTGKLMKVEGGLYELFFRTVPRPVCWTLEKAVGIKECHSIGLRRTGKLLGNVTILAQTGTQLNAGVIEAFVNQASIALERRRAVAALLQAEERFRTLYESVQAGVLLQRADGVILHANRMACDIFGMTAESVQSKTSMDPVWQMILEDGTPVPGEDHPSMITLRTGEPIRGAIRGLFSGDSSHTRWLLINTEPLRHRDHDAVEQVMVTFHDITALKQAEEELQQSERRKTLLNRIANAFLTVGDDRMYEEVLAIVLETMESQFGVFGFIADNGDLVIPTMTREIWADCQVPGKSMVFPPATWGDSLWGRALQEQKGFCSQGPFHTPPGHIPIDSFLTTPIVFGNRTIGLLSVANRPRGYTAADQDLLQSIADYFSPILNARLERDRQEQERREAQQRLRESEEKYRELFENAREAIVILDLDGIVTDINPFVEEYGFHKTDLIGRNHLELVVESYREKAVQDWTQLRQGIPQEGEYELLTPKGRIVVHYKDCPITREGQVIRVQSTITDVTERRRVEDALRQSEAKYHMLHDSLRDGFVSVDMEGHIIEFNKIYQEMLGYAEEELHQLTYQDLTPPEWREMEATIVNDQILARGYSDVYEKEYRRKDGIVVPIELRTVLLRDANDRPMGMWALIRDITERKQGEETLRESEARYRLLANYASDIIWTTDLNLQLTYCSPSVERILGYTLGEALSRKADEDVTPASRTLVQQTLAEEMEIERSGQGDPLRSRVIEVEEIRKDGTTLWAEIRAGFLRDANGAATGIVGVTRDISERRKLEREIVVREKYLSSFFTGATAGLALLDKDLRYVQINDTLAEMNGMPAQDHLGRTIREVIPKLAPMVEPIFRKVFTTGEPVLNVEVTGPTVKDSSVQRHWVESFFPIVGADGTPEAVGVIVVEITERKRVEQQLLEYQDKLRELAAELTLAEERERRRIAVGVHDQIGQRLALTKLALQSLQTTTTTENNTSQVLDGICQEIDKVIEDVHSLTFELSNPILYEVGFEPAVESWLGQQIQERHGIACTFAADEPAAELDKETRVVLFDIVREILTNVVKHAQAKRVDVHIRHGDGLLQIDVRDDGIGFSPARTGASVSKSGGFGLFNIREKLEYLGGSITIDTAPAKGTSITIVVPLQHPRNSRDAKGSYENLDR